MDEATLISELKKFPILQTLTEENVKKLAGITTQKSVHANDVVFEEDELTEAIYFVQSGSVRITKPTPFGEQVLAFVKPLEFFGELDFIDYDPFSMAAVANEDSLLLLMSKNKLEEIFASQKQIAVQFYWHFWKMLAQRIRQTNELLKSFFDQGRPEEKREITAHGGQATVVDFDEKIALLKEKGLSSNELQSLTAFSYEEFYSAGQNIFLEGQAGDRLYIVLEGKVRISKHIPGGGEEALAILGKGDFFGEMALIDHSPRSADAKAHTDATVLPIEIRLLIDMLSADLEGSYQFLVILCKILSRRLRATTLKVYQWRMMCGGFS